MKIYLGTDHAGLDLKEEVKTHLLSEGYEVVDYGAYDFNNEDDYPDFIGKVGEAISSHPSDKGIIFGGSGQGEAIVANKYKGVRAVIFYSPRIPPHAADATGRISDDPYEMLRLTREHNNANVLSLGARLLTVTEALTAVDIWLASPFSKDVRHQRRIDKISDIESKW